MAVSGPHSQHCGATSSRIPCTWVNSSTYFSGMKTGRE